MVILGISFVLQIEKGLIYLNDELAIENIQKSKFVTHLVLTNGFYVSISLRVKYIEKRANLMKSSLLYLKFGKRVGLIITTMETDENPHLIGSFQN